MVLYEQIIFHYENLLFFKKLGKKQVYHSFIFIRRIQIGIAEMNLIKSSKHLLSFVFNWKTFKANIMRFKKIYSNPAYHLRGTLQKIWFVYFIK